MQSLLLALTPGDVSRLYAGSYPELKQALLWVLAMVSIGAEVGFLTYGIHHMAPEKHWIGRRWISTLAHSCRRFFRICGLFFIGDSREPHRVVWTDNEIVAEFHEDNVEKFNFERTTEGTLVSVHGKPIHPPKPIGNTKSILFGILALVLVLVFAIPTFLILVAMLCVVVPTVLISDWLFENKTRK